MGASLKKLSLFLVLPLLFSSCDFFTKTSSTISRVPQSDESETYDKNEPGASLDSAAEIIQQNAQAFSHSVSKSASESIQKFNDNIPNDSNISKLCSLPREFANPVLYDQYCGNSCTPVNSTCEDHSDCCSHRCSNGVCQPGGGHFVPVNGRCQQPSDCETGLCSRHPVLPYKICYGSVVKGVCSFVNESCLDTDNCCSGRCFKNKCIGSPKYPANTGQSCYNDHDECASNQCNFITHRCR